jgi:hypothetical protein
MLNFIGWLVVGAVAGIVWMRRRTKPTLDRISADARAASAAAHEKVGRSVIARARGEYLGAYTVGAVVGAILGMLFWAVATVLIWLMNMSS